MRLNREKRVGMIISVTPLVDVMMILLIFFMVTSTYLDLDMVPLVGGDRPDGEPSAAAAPAERVSDASSLLVRLSADGSVYMSGQPVTLAALTSIVQVRITTRPSAPVLVLPSGAATTQSLVSLMDAIANAGARNVRVVRLSPQ